jgi:hypothetical protein
MLTITVACGFLTLAASSVMGKSHWWNPNPNARFEVGGRVSGDEARRVKVTSLGPLQ